MESLSVWTLQPSIAPNASVELIPFQESYLNDCFLDPAHSFTLYSLEIWLLFLPVCQPTEKI